MSGVSIDITLEAAASGMDLAQLQARLDHPEEPLREIGEVTLASTHQRFNQAVDPNGKPWAPLSPRTLKRKRGPGILRESLHLQGSTRYQIIGGELLLGTDVPYARIHQLGGTIKHKARAGAVYFHHDARSGEVGPRFVHRSKSNFAQDVKIRAHTTKIPARPFLGLSDQDKTAIGEIIGDYLAGK